MAANTALPTGVSRMKVNLGPDELDLIDEGLIVLGAFLMKTGREKEAQKVTELIRKFQTTQLLSTTNSIMMEPMK